MKIRFSILLSLALMPAALANAADWPNYGGPNHNNISPEAGLLQQWPEGGPEMRWQRPLGPGYGGAAIRDGKVYMLTGSTIRGMSSGA